jgi:hypothetical protein
MALGRNISQRNWLPYPREARERDRSRSWKSIVVPDRGDPMMKIGRRGGWSRGRSGPTVRSTAPAARCRRLVFEA